MLQYSASRSENSKEILQQNIPFYCKRMCLQQAVHHSYIYLWLYKSEVQQKCLITLALSPSYCPSHFQGTAVTAW